MTLEDQIQLKNVTNPSVLRQVAEGEVTGTISPVNTGNFASTTSNKFKSVDDVLDKAIADTKSATNAAADTVAEMSDDLIVGPL